VSKSQTNRDILQRIRQGRDAERRGGLAAATLSSLQQWQEWRVSEAAFWQSCSFDPPETFSASGKKE
jgi:hypothetical protein